MENPIIESIIKQKKPLYFISPHFDDAVFSAGALMLHLAQYTDIFVINVFTKAGEPPYTLSAKTYLQQCNYQDAKVLYTDREKEDAHALQKVAKKVTNLGFVDALWRRKKKNFLFSEFFKSIEEFKVIYPTYRWHIIKGKIAKDDQETVTDIKKKLQDIIPSEAVIFCPIGTGSHVDHVVTRTACEEQFKNVIYWSDFPYNVTQKEEMTEFSSISFDKDLTYKQKLAELYGTQYEAMFKDGFPQQAEVFYTKEKE